MIIMYIHTCNNYWVDFQISKQNILYHSKTIKNKIIHYRILDIWYLHYYRCKYEQNYKSSKFFVTYSSIIFVFIFFLIQIVQLISYTNRQDQFQGVH
jgi:hypothetical protein